MWLVVNVTGIHTAKPSEPRVPDVYPNQIVFCLSKLGISKKVISSAQSGLHCACEYSCQTELAFFSLPPPSSSSS